MTKQFSIAAAMLIFCLLFANSTPAIAYITNQETDFWKPLPEPQETAFSTNPIPYEEINVLSETNYNINRYRTYERGYSIRIHDINQDGWKDVIFTTDTRHVRIWLQNPNCHQLQEWLRIETYRFPLDLEIADLNRDGKMEIITMEYAEGTDQAGYIQIYAPSQNGYAPVGDPYKVGEIPNKIKIGDVSGDNLPDILVSTWSSLDVLTQQQGGGYSLRSITNPEIVLGQSPNDIAIADLNRDGKNDVILQVYGRPNGIIVYFQGNGTLAAGITLPWPFASQYEDADAMTVGDVTGDGLADIIAVSTRSKPLAKVVLYIQSPGGGVGNPVIYDTHDISESPVVADMNNDGKNDLVLISSFGSYVIHYQTQDRKLGPATLIPVGDVVYVHYSSVNSNFSAVGDVTGDGKLDGIFIGDRDGLVLVAQGLAPSCPTPIPPRAKTPKFNYGVINNIDGHEAVAIDIDNDGLEDVLTIVKNYSNPSEHTYIQVVNQISDGTFRLGKRIDMGTLATLSGLSAGDINNDGLVDVSVFNKNSYGNPGLYLALQKNDGTFDVRVDGNSVPISSATNISDWTGDNLNDVAVLSSNGIDLLAQQIDGTLAGPTVYAQGAFGATSLYDVTDWNGDGRKDFAGFWWKNELDKPIRVLQQKSEGSFDLLPPIHYGSYIQDFATGDINNDQRPDIVVSYSANVPRGRLGLVYQKTDGGLSQSVILSDPQFSSPGSVVIADLNFDKRNDLLVFNTGNFGTTVFTQNQQSKFDTPLYYELYTQNNDFGHSVAKIDSDKDGTIDVIVYVTNDMRIIFLKLVGGKRTFLPLLRR